MVRTTALWLTLAIAATVAGAAPEPRLRIRTVAGAEVGLGHRDARGGDARFSTPEHLAIGCDGAIVLADSGNHTIRRITEDGEATTIAGEPYIRGSIDGVDALFAAPEGIAVASDCSIWVADTGNHTLRRIAPDGTVVTVAGMAGVAGSANGSGGSARFDTPIDVAIDPASGDAFVADLGSSSIRRVTPGGSVTTLAAPSPALNQPNGVAFDATGRLVVAELYGNSIRFRKSDGAWSRLTFRPNAYPADAVAAADGTLYVTDQLNSVIWSVIGGAQTMVAGTYQKIGEDDGPAGTATFAQPRGIGVLSDGTLVVSESRNALIRRVQPGVSVKRLAGQNAEEGANDGLGLQARFRAPRHAVEREDGTIFVTDGTTVRQIAPDGSVTTLAGLDGTSGSADGRGSAARFRIPYGIAIAPDGAIFVSDSLDHVIRRITLDGTVTTVVGKAGTPGALDGVGTDARLFDPYGIACDADGNLYVADRGSHTVRKVSAGEYRVTAHAGLLGAIGSGDGPASQARFFNPWDVDVAADGTVYVVDENNHVVQKIANGQVTTVARTHDELRSFGLAVAQEDTIWVSESQSSTIRRATLAGGEPYIGARLEAGNRPGGAGRARLSRATGIDLGPSGRLVIADTDNAVVKVAEVVHGPWIDELIALPASTAGDSPVRLEWCSDGAVLATISPSVGAVEPCGSVEVSPAETTTYTLEVSSSEGIARSSVTVTVVAPVRQRSARP